jgi:hypothetical protein
MATTAADRELQEGEQTERVRSSIEQELEEQGVDPDNVNIDIQETEGGFTADITPSEEEEFGDFTLEFGGQAGDPRTRVGTRLATNEANPAAPEGDTGPVTFEEAVGDLSEGYRERVSETFETGLLSDPITDDVVGAFAGEETGERAGEAVSTTAEAALQSLNPFQASLGIKEAVEFGAYTVSETLEGDLGVNLNTDAETPGATELAEMERDADPEVSPVETTEEGLVGRTGRAAGDVVAGGVDFIQENPVEGGAMLTGSLLGTGAVLGAASKAGRVPGATARYAIQPGEELAGTVGYRATRAASGTPAAERLFPNREPLIFSEEAAIRGGKAAGRFTRAKASSGLDVGKSAVARAKSRLPDRSEITPDTSGESFFIDTRTGELVEEGSIRPALFDPEAETNVAQADRPDMVQDLDTDGDTETTPGSGAGGGGDLSGVVEIDLRKDTGMVETSLLEFEGDARTRTVSEAESETDLTPETETEVRTDQEVRRVQPTDVSEAQAAAETMDIGVEPSATEFQAERQTQPTAIDTETRARSETGVEQELAFETEQATETALEQEVDQEVRLETETAVETRREVEAERRILPDESERRRRRRGDDFTKLFESEVATSEDVLEGESSLDGLSDLEDT